MLNIYIILLVIEAITSNTNVTVKKTCKPIKHVV